MLISSGLADGSAGLLKSSTSKEATSTVSGPTENSVPHCSRGRRGANPIVIAGSLAARGGEVSESGGRSQGKRKRSARHDLRHGWFSRQRNPRTAEKSAFRR